MISRALVTSTYISWLTNQSVSCIVAPQNMPTPIELINEPLQNDGLDTARIRAYRLLL